MIEADGFGHMDPDRTFIYKDLTVWYGFVTNRFCFKCLVRNGYLTGNRSTLPESYAWAIGQHIDTVAGFVHALFPLRLHKPI